MTDRALQKTITILSSDTDRFQRLRMSALFRFLQEASILDTELAGVTKEKTLDKGLLWVIARIRIELKRPIFYDETITISTWPDETMHLLFPRQYEITDASHQIIGKGAAIWLLIDQKTRSAIVPSSYDIAIPSVNGGSDAPMPGSIPLIQGDEKILERTAQYSEIDLNGHVNNTRYLDWIDDCFSMQFHQNYFFHTIQLNYDKEITDGEKVELHIQYGDMRYRIDGKNENQTAFNAYLSAGSLFQGAR